MTVHIKVLCQDNQGRSPWLGRALKGAIIQGLRVSSPEKEGHRGGVWWKTQSSDQAQDRQQACGANAGRATGKLKSEHGCKGIGGCQ